MTKKDFIKFAEMFASELNKCENENQRDAIRSVCSSTVTIFKTDNPNFDTSRFLSAIAKDTDIR